MHKNVVYMNTAILYSNTLSYMVLVGIILVPRYSMQNIVILLQYNCSTVVMVDDVHYLTYILSGFNAF